jgi:hypothetical protein
VTTIPWEPWSHSDQKLIREQLDRILRSGPFLQSRRRQRFLEYIVNETLTGRGDRLKGYNIAREVFDRPEGFDPNVDPIVRMEAARLRDRLREYYGAEGRDDPVRIELPKGTYKPQIEFRHGFSAPGDVHASITIKDRPSWKRRQITLLFIAPTLLLAAIGLWFADSFWRSQPRELTPMSVRSSTGVPAIAVLPFVNPLPSAS